MLTGCAKAYSSSYPQAVTHRHTNWARRRVTSFQLKRVNNYATPPKPVPWRCLVNGIDLSRSKAPKKSIKPSVLAFKVIQGHWIWRQSKASIRFPISIRVNGQKSQILPTPLSFSALVRGDPFWIYGKALWFLKLESSRQPMVKIWQS